MKATSMKIKSLVTGLASITVLAFSADASAQSFNCRLAKTPDEVKICQSDKLRQLDQQVADLYSAIITSSDSTRSYRNMIERTQRTWLARRGNCRSSFTCLNDSYEARIEELTTDILGD